MELDSPLDALSGIGPARAARLAEAGLRTVEDLLLHLPSRFEDRQRVPAIADLREGQPATIRARVEEARLIRTRRRGFTIVQARLSDPTGSVRAVWFNQPYLARTFAPRPEPGEGPREGFFFAAPKAAATGPAAWTFENAQFELIGPGIETGGETGGESGSEPEPIHTARVVPIHRSVGGLTPRTLRRLIHAALEELDGRIEDFLPAPLRRRRRLTWRASALRDAHFPETIPEPGPGGALDPAMRRLVFEEFFLLQVGLVRRRMLAAREERGFRYRFDERTRERLRALLPFPLTRAQQRVLREIRADLEGPAPMNRLLQGDVGSGKTIVAALALAIGADNGLQGALLAPTEVLARQHARRLVDLLGPAGIRVELLTGSLQAAARRRVLAAAASGEADLLVGTHALLSDPVRFARLGLVVIDEQHRFGVAQRSRLRAKGEPGRVPDTLVMTATPIPRSLALTLYGDLDVSILDELPPGRRPAKTLVRGEEHRPRIYDGIRRELDRGRQAFFVYPLVKESDTAGLKAAVEMSKELAAGPFARYRVGLVHGKQDRAERAARMDAFERGELDLLVATTVVEVGLDVPNATVLVVEHPDRFGLAQLHQLRGRVGRGSEKSYCILIAGEGIGPDAVERLDLLSRESSGFKLAEIDFERRGAGDIAGTLQHGGAPWLRVGNLGRDGQLMALARREAQGWLAALEKAGKPLPAEVARRVDRCFEKGTAFAEVG